MQFTLLTPILATLLTLTTALPTPDPSYPASISITLHGTTPEAQYTVSIPTTSSFIPTYNSLSISHVSTTGGPCGLFGIDGLLLEIDSATYVDVGPPQTIVGIACGPKKGESGW